MNRLKNLMAVPIAVTVLAGCGQKGPGTADSGYVPKPSTATGSAFVPAGQEATYFPLAKGNQWTFTSTTLRKINGRQDAPVTQNITYRVSEVRALPGGGVDAWFAIQNEDKLVDRQVWRIDAHGIYQLSLGHKLNQFSTPQMVLPIPVKVGAKFSWKGTVKSDSGEIRTGSNDGRISGEEPADTETGYYNALTIESKGELSSPTSKSKVASRLWLIPNVGIGRYRQEALAEITSTDPKTKGQKFVLEILQTMKLKNYSLKK